MSNNNLSILINAQINEAASLGDINKSLKQLGKKVNSLNIKINIDQSVLTNLASLSNNLGNITKQIAQQNAANVKNTQEIKNQTKATEDAIIAERKLGIEKQRTNSKGVTTTTYGNSNNNNKEIVKTYPDGAVQMEYTKNQLKDYKDAEKIDRDRYNAIKTNKKMIEALEKVHYLALQKNRELDWKNLQATNKQGEALDKAHYQALKHNSEMTIKNSQQTQSLVNSAFSGKQSANSASSGIADAKALDLLNRKYSETIARLNEAKNSGKQLTESELNGINRRITALNNLSTRQKQAEKERANLSSAQLNAEVLVNNLTTRYGSKVDSAGLNNLLSQLQALNTTVPQFKTKAQSLVQQIQQIGSSARSTAVETNNLGSTFKNAFTRIAMFAGVGSLMYAPFQAIKSGIKHVYELDIAMTDLKKVTDETNNTYINFIQSSAKTANEIGGLTLDVIKSTTEWARLGYTIQQAQQLAKQTIVYQNVGDIKSAEDASTQLIASMKGFGIEVDAQGKNIQNVVDIYNEVGNKFAISTEGIGEAVRRSASSLSEAGNTIEQSVAMITAANSTVQDPAKVGNALKTISMRIRGVSEDGEDLSDVMPKMEEKFNSIGLSLRKNDDTFKSTYEIFSDLSKVWGSLSDMSRAGVLELVAGKMQGNIASSMIKNWSDAEGALNAGLNSFGSAAKENSTYLDSMQGKVAIFKNSVSSFWNGAINSEDAKVLIDMGTSLINTFAQVTNVFGGLGTGIGIATLALLSFNSAIKAGTVVKLTQYLSNAGLQFKSLAWFTNLYTTSTVSARLATIALQASLTLGLSVALAAVVSGISSLIQKNRENEESLKAAKEQNEQVANSWMKNSDTIENLIKKYDKLNTATKNGTVFTDTEQEQKYRDLIEQISDLMPNLVSRIDEKGDKHLKNAEAIKGEIEYTKTLVELQKQASLNSAREDFQANIDLIEASKKKLDEFKKDQDNAMKDGMTGVLVPGYGIDKVVEDMQTYKTAAEINVLNTQNEISNQTDVLKTQLRSMINTYLDLNKVKINESTSKVIQDMVNALDPSKIDSADKLVSAYQNIATAVLLISKDNKTDEEKARLESLLVVLGWTDKTVSTVSDSFRNFGSATGAAIDGTEALNSAAKALNKRFDDTIDSLSTLSSGYETLNKGEELSADTLIKLIDQYPELAKHLADTNDFTFKKGELLKVVAEIERKTRIDEFQNSLDAVENTREELTQKQNLYKEFYEKMLVYGYDEDSFGSNFKLTPAEEESLDGMNKQADNLKAKIAALSQPLSFYSSSTDKAKKSNDKLNNSQSETVEILTDLQKALINVKKATEDLENKRSKMRKGSQEYRNSLMEENKLLEKRIKLLNEGIANPDKLISKKVTTTVKSSDGDFSSSSSSSSSPSDAISNMLSNALGLQGKLNKYGQVGGKFKGTYEEFVKGATSDCSQFVQEMFDEFLNTNIPRTAAEQAKQGVAVSKADLQKGDLVFFNTTGADNSHVGIYSGDGKFLQMGSTKNGGLKESDINSSYWASKYQGARRISGSSASSSSTGTTTIKNGNTTVKTQNGTDKERQDAIDSGVQEKIDALNTIDQNNLEQLASTVYKYERLIAIQEAKIEVSKKTQDTIDPNSAEWRKENEKQINIQSAIQKLNDEERSNLTSMMKALNINSDEYDDIINQLIVSSSDIQADKIVKVVANINSQLDAYESGISSLNSTIDLSNAKLSNMVEGSEDYRKELLSQIPILNQQQSIRKDAISLAENQLKNDKLTIVEKGKLSDRLKQLKIDWEENNTAIKNVTNSILELANDALSSLFDSLKNSLSFDEVLNLDEFNDSVDSIIASLDGIDDKFIDGVSFVDATSSSRSDLANYASTIKDVASQVKVALNYATDMSNINFSNMRDLGNQITSQINLVASLKSQLEAMNNTIRDTELQYSKEEASLENLIKTQEKYYDSQIKAQQELLASLDDQIEKEDRIKALKDINDELNKVKNDKRFSYITEAGEEILTYDKAKVDELEKQKDELVKQYEREDIKSAIQDGIDRLEKEKNDTVTILQEKLEKTKQIHQQSLEAMRLYQSNMSTLYDAAVADTQTKLTAYQEAIEKGMKDGSISADEGSKLLELVVDGWQASSLQKWDIYISSVASNLAKLKALYADMANLSMPSGGGGGGNSSNNNSSGSLESAKSDAISKIDTSTSAGKAAADYINNLVSVDGNKISDAALEAIKFNTEFKNRKYHTGGIVGEEPLAKNEVPAILKTGELVLTKEHQERLKGMFMRQPSAVTMATRDMQQTLNRYNSSSVVNNQKTSSDIVNHNSYTFGDIKTNDPMELFRGIERHINSNKK